MKSKLFFENDKLIGLFWKLSVFQAYCVPNPDTYSTFITFCRQCKIDTFSISKKDLGTQDVFFLWNELIPIKSMTLWNSCFPKGPLDGMYSTNQVYSCVRLVKKVLCTAEKHCLWMILITNSSKRTGHMWVIEAKGLSVIWLQHQPTQEHRGYRTFTTYNLGFGYTASYVHVSYSSPHSRSNSMKPKPYRNLI